MNAVVIVVDRLQAGYLGCYGNCWVETPALDRLSCTGLTLDQAYIDAPDLQTIYRGYWRGQTALMPDDVLPPPSLIELAGRRGIHTLLITDEPRVELWGTQAGFEEALFIPPEINPDDLCAPAAELEQTQFARLFAAASAVLGDLESPFLLWIHARGMGADWDAPLELGARYADDDVPLPTGVSVPCAAVTRQTDPDEVLAIRWKYAAQVTLLDACLGAWRERFEELGLAENTLFTLLGARGFPLGEHGQIGVPEEIDPAESPAPPADPAESDAAPPAPVPMAHPPADTVAAAASAASPVPHDRAPRSTLYEELLHIPWFVRQGAEREPTRSQYLAQPADLFATLAQALDLQGDPASCGGVDLGQVETAPPRDALCTLDASRAERSIRTRGWRLRWRQGPPAAPPEGAELFVKPDDRWEVNEVSSRRAGLIEPLTQAFAAQAHWAATDPTHPAPRLDSELTASSE